jgi:hypothetical protein|tara:strand:+ start:1999 stop:2316 length:318 start_codon:yes stop_codon:yes gene_type:complete
MWEMLSNMAGDRLWIYTAIGGSIIGLAFSTWFSTTRMALWLYARFDRGMDFLVERWGWTWLEQPENAWRKKYPKITQKIDDMEMRLKNLETKSNTKIIRQKETKK